MATKNVYLVGSVRTPIGRYGGALAGTTAAELGASIARACLERAGVAAEAVQEVIWGCARQAGTGPNVARQITYRAGLSARVPAFTVNQACGSGLKAIILAAQEIMLGRADVLLAGGVENMSRVPYLAEGARWGMRMGNVELVDGERLCVDVTRRMGAERATLVFVPRASARAGIEAVRAARLRLCEQLAALACAHLTGAQVERVRLSAGARRSEPGRYARIVLRRGRELVAVTGAVVETKARDADALLTSALMWWLRLQRQRRYAGLRRLWLVVSRESREALGQRLALLRAELRRDITLYERDETWQVLTQATAPELTELLEARPRALRSVGAELSATAARIVALAPAAIDVVRARHGETLRFHGLAFARVRSLMGREQVWFGTGARRLLTEENWPELAKLLDELRTHRAADAPDHRHALYAAAPEAWLESLLRRDITRLDPGLILAPLHAQFRPAPQTNARARPVDLLALRRDGRLAVIELKVAEDVALPLQAADYWRRVEQQRRAGHIAQARLFDDLPIADEPPLVYLAAPLLRFHRAFETLARALRAEVEIYRFDLNEDWRAGVRVARRVRVV